MAELALSPQRWLCAPASASTRHLQPVYRDLGHRAGDSPVSERLAGEVLSLPMFSELTIVQMEMIAAPFRAGLSSVVGSGR